MSRVDEHTLIHNELGARPDRDTAAQIELVYDELRGLSRAYLSQERPDHTLQATALVHEAFLAISPRTRPWVDRTHFFRAAAKAMRHILVNHAKARAALKRGGGEHPVRLHETALVFTAPEIDVLVLDDALRRLSELDPDKGHVVELRFFAGCSIEQAAEVLGVSTATVERHWRFARAWLRTELGEGDHAHE
ncbi:MAG: ECF-type sigma factor [Phycisphaerales bacterium JB059]